MTNETVVKYFETTESEIYYTNRFISNFIHLKIWNQRLFLIDNEFPRSPHISETTEPIQTRPGSDNRLQNAQLDR